MNESPGYETKGCRYSVVQYVVLKVCINIFDTGCGSAWLERLVWDQEVAGSNPVTPIQLNVFSILIMREWLRGGAPPCQGGGRGFESRLAL